MCDAARAFTVAALLATASCGAAKGETSAHPVRPRSEPPVEPSPAAALEVYSACWQALARKAAEEFGACFADDARTSLTDWVPEMGGNGPAGAADLVRRQLDAFPDLQLTPLVLFSNGIEVAVVYRFHGTNSAAPRNGAATGKAVTMYGVAAATLGAAGKKLTRNAHWLDQRTLLTELGALPTKGPPPPATAAAPVEWFSGWPERNIVEDSDTGRSLAAKNVGTVQEIVRRQNKKDVTAFDFYADDMLFVFHPVGRVTRGKEGYVKAMQDYFASVSDESGLEIQRLWGAGDFAIAEMVMRNHPAKKAGDGKAPGPSYAEQRLYLIRFQGGKIIEQHVFGSIVSSTVQQGRLSPEQIVWGW